MKLELIHKCRNKGKIIPASSIFGTIVCCDACGEEIDCDKLNNYNLIIREE